MAFTRQELLDPTRLNREAWAAKEEFIQVTPNVTMRIREYGWLEIVDQLPEVSRAKSDCPPRSVHITEYDGDTSDWFDATAINLQYMAARTLMTTRSNDGLIDAMASFTLGFVDNSTVVNDKHAFNAARRFKRIHQLLKHPQIHNVPSYSLATIRELAEIMYDRFKLYDENEQRLETEIARSFSRVQDMQVFFDTVEQTQEQYFEAELMILNAIFTSANESWHWSFEHRNEMENTINQNLGSIFNSSIDMQADEYEHLLEEAEASVDHYEAVVEKYKAQIQR